jgi:hypothetical protein
MPNEMNEPSVEIFKFKTETDAVAECSVLI